MYKKSLLIAALLFSSINVNAAELVSVGCTTDNDNVSTVEVYLNYNSNEHGKWFFVWAKDIYGNTHGFEETLSIFDSSSFDYRFKQLEGPIVAYNVWSLTSQLYFDETRYSCN